MIIAPTDEGVCLRWREGEGDEPIRNEKFVSFNDFRPYFYVRRDDAVKDRSSTTNKWGKKTEFDFTYEHDVPKAHA